VLTYLDGRLEMVISVDITGDKITNFYVMRNPEKLTTLAVTREISRD
jgi:RNA polymerase sigma-70 factor, ECF subfamily